MAAPPEEETDDGSPVHLGFCEPIQDIQHSSEIAHNSPHWSDWDGGQVGGQPSWLNPRDLPMSPLCCTNDECSSSTNVPLRFICQLYAPADTVHPNAFHRTLYVFGCSTCSSVRVLRTQLAQENDFYPASEDNNSVESWKDPELKLCKVCGQRGKGVCPLQHESFCSKYHQKEYKKHVFDAKEANREAVLPSVYPMYELVVEEEPLVSNDGDDSNRETMFEANDDDDADQDLEQDDLNAMTGAKSAARNNGDAMTDIFFARVERAKDQCVRYHQWQDDAPLWMSASNVPTEIPDCSYCGAPRKFEFQLMPQVLHYLKQSSSKSSTDTIPKQQKEALLAASTIVEKTDPNEIPAEFKETHDKAVENVQSKLLGNKGELEWGVVVVYTCTASCGGSSEENNADYELGAYREEYAWVQPSLG